MDECAGWVGGPESGSKLPHSKRFASQVAALVIGHQRLSAWKIQAHKDQDPEKVQVPKFNMNDGFGQMDERAGWAGGSESGSKLPHSKRFASQVAALVIGHRRLSARKIQAHKDQDPEKFQIQDPI